MTSPDTTNEANDAAEVVPPPPSPSPPPPPAPSAATRAIDDDDGPQPGNVAPPSSGRDDDEEDDGPQPGNERGPSEPVTASVESAEKGDGAKKRRRRRKKKGGAADAQPGAVDEAGNVIAEPRRARPDRPERERPAFVVGDEVFGKIVELTEDALFVDLSGKGRAIFDRRELEIAPGSLDGFEDEAYDDAPAVPTAVPEGGDGAASADAAVPAEAAAVTEAAASVDAASPVAEALAVPAETEPDAVAAPETPAAEPEAALEPAPVDGNVATARAAKPEQAPLPPVVLELGANFVGIVHNDGGRGGLVVLTRHPRRIHRARAIVGGAFKEKGVVLGLVTGVIKGGVEVDVEGLRAFCPGSHMDMRLGVDLTPQIGRRLSFFVTQYAKRGRDVVLSRRAILEEEAKAQREQVLATLTAGMVLEGTVRSVVQFGAFVDVGGAEGLVPLSEMSHKRSEGPHDVFKVGETVSVKVLKVDERGKIWLSRKATIPDPWLEAGKKYASGTKHNGTVVRLQPFGAFIELESGIDGLVHTADLSLKQIEHPSEVVKVGDAIEVIVGSVDAHNHKIGLYPAPTGTAASEAPQKVQLHKTVKVEVASIEPTGLLVRVLGVVGRHARGYIPGAATGTPRGTDLKKSFPVGTQIDAKVVELDSKRGELRLSIKSLQDDTERSAYQQYRQQVSRDAKFTLADLIAKKLPQR